MIKPITPYEASSGFEDFVRADVDRLIETINTKLRRGIGCNNRPVVMTFPEYDAAIVDLVLTRFKEAGWEIGIQNCRNDTFYTFKS